MAEETHVVHDHEKHRYEIWSGDELAGFSEYREHGDRTVFTHTEIKDAFGGRGLGKLLVGEALDDAVKRGRMIVPLCPFIAGYLRKNTQYDEHVRWPESGGTVPPAPPPAKEGS
jgi:predicted GNAT family acetyltransferase